MLACIRASVARGSGSVFATEFLVAAGGGDVVIGTRGGGNGGGALGARLLAAEAVVPECLGARVDGP